MSPIGSSVLPPSKVLLEVSPSQTFVDEEIGVRATGVLPHQLVHVRATVLDDEKRVWTSQAEFRAEESGCVDLSVQKSLGGSYRGRSAMGLFWSMSPRDEIAAHVAFAKREASSIEVKLDAIVDGSVVAWRDVERRFPAPGTEVRDLKIANGSDGESTIGRLFIPPAQGGERHPVVIVLGGSGGGFDVDKAAVLSRHGFATLALAYFGIPPLPAWLHRIPLEYFESALRWLGAQPEVDAKRTGLLGVSRGAELGLLLGTVLPEIRAIAAYAPSAVAWAAGGPDKVTGELIPTWTWRGEPLPFAPMPLRGFMFRSAIPVLGLRRPVIFRNLFRAGLRNRRAIEPAAIQVERIAAPLLLISGGDDHLWPAEKMCEVIVTRRNTHGGALHTEHVNYPKAGHNLRYPYLPTTSRYGRNAHLRGARFSFGGTAIADAEAQADSWARTIRFLQVHLF